MKVAVIGAGCAGFSAAWALSKQHDVTLFEAADRPGGHSHTVDVPFSHTNQAGPSLPVDTGFIVYNNHTYPNFLRLLDEIGVESEDSDMSFAVSLGDGAYEYFGSTAGMFAQKRNALRPSHWQLVGDLLRFYKEAPNWLAKSITHALTVGDLLKEGGYSDVFAYRHILPMAGAIWSTPVEDVRNFPAETFLRFFVNHRLFAVDPKDRPIWRTVTGGSRSYVNKFMALLGDRVKLGTPVLNAKRDARGVTLTLGGNNAGTAHFDQVVFAAHTDQTLAIIDNEINAHERDILSAIRYCENRAVLHRDASLMPRRKKAWASWNYLAPTELEQAKKSGAVALTYWMNRLQNFASDEQVFVTLNPIREPAANLVQAEHAYAHPLFDRAAIDAQSALPSIQGHSRFWYCGAWAGYGFHEDGVASGLAVAQAMGCATSWSKDVNHMSPAFANCTPDLSVAQEMKLVAE